MHKLTLYKLSALKHSMFCSFCYNETDLNYVIIYNKIFQDVASTFQLKQTTSKYSTCRENTKRLKIYAYSERTCIDMPCREYHHLCCKVSSKGMVHVCWFTNLDTHECRATEYCLQILKDTLRDSKSYKTQHKFFTLNSLKAYACE